MSDTIIVDGVNLLSTFGAYVFPKEVEDTPEKEITTYKVPGRHGVLLGTVARMENVNVAFDVVIAQNAKTNLAALRNFLSSREGYIRIDDPNDQEHFRMGLFKERFQPILTKDGTQAKGEIRFNCQPQRWLVSGETTVEMTSTQTIENPTLFVAKEFLRIYLSGGLASVSFEPNENIITILSTAYSDGYEYVDIDCETMACFNGETNLSDYVSIREADTSKYGVDAPTLLPGLNRISTSNVSKVAVTPRWWEV